MISANVQPELVKFLSCMFVAECLNAQPQRKMQKRTSNSLSLICHLLRFCSILCHSCHNSNGEYINVFLLSTYKYISRLLRTAISQCNVTLLANPDIEEETSSNSFPS